jgi:hypothetical protein
MKTPIIFSLVVAALLALGLNLRSQAPVSPAGPRTTLQVLQAMKAKNQELIEKQKATLTQLETLEKEAEQMKIFAKRS